MSASISNLSKLKGASNKRKVGTQPDFLQDLDSELDTDVSGVSAPEDMPIEHEPSMNPRSYDVRANQVIEPENMWTKLGKALAMQAGSTAPTVQPTPEVPPIETQQVDLQEGLPPISASQEEARPQQENQPIDMNKYLKIAQLARARDEENSVAERNRKDINQPASPELIQQAKELLGREPGKNEFDAQIDAAIQKPFEEVVPGSAQAIAEDPNLQIEFKDITGVDYTPEIQQQLSIAESALDAIQQEKLGQNVQLDEQAERMKQRIDSNSATDQDKYLIGMALLLPLLIGGVFGAEAGVGALGGALEGLSQSAENRQNQSLKNEQGLLEIAKQKGANTQDLADIEMKRSGLRSQIEQALPKTGKEHLEGLREAVWTNPENGKEEEIVEILPGFVVQANKLNSEKTRERFEKKADKLAEMKSFTDEVNDLTGDMITVMTQLEERGFTEQAFKNILNGKAPGVLSKLSPEVLYKGKMVNAGTLLNQKSGFLANAYAQAKKLGQLDRAAQAHFEKIINNPETTFISPKDAIQQMLETRALVQKDLINNARNGGFIPQFMEQEF